MRTAAGGGIPAEALRHGDCVAAAELLAGPLGAPAKAAEWQRRCRALFPWSQYFEGPARSLAPGLAPPTANGGGSAAGTTAANGPGGGARQGGAGERPGALSG